MTPQIALKRLQNWMDDDGIGEIDIVTLITAKEALEKQIPFKPEINDLKVGVGRCKCGAEFLDRETNYCGNCGQALNWGDEE